MSLIHSYFCEFQETNGGVISINSGINLNVVCSIFENNKATQLGGSIYFANGVICVNKTYFKKSRSTSNTDGIGGNAVYQGGNYAIFNHVSSFLCAIQKEESGDTTFYLKNEGQIEYLNSSSNTGTGGSGSIALYGSISSYAKFMNTIHPRDDFAIESWQSKFTVSNSNYVDFDKTINLAVIWMKTSNILRFTECCFFETYGTTFSYRDYSCEIDLCYSDYENNAMFTYNEKITSYDFHIEQTCSFIYNRSCENKKAKILSLIYIFICIINS